MLGSNGHYSNKPNQIDALMNSDLNSNRVESQVRRGRPKIPPKWSRIIDLQAAEGYIIESSTSIRTNQMLKKNRKSSQNRGNRHGNLYLNQRNGGPAISNMT